MKGFSLDNPNILQIDSDAGPSQHAPIALRCPHCKHQGIFHSAIPGAHGVRYTKAGKNVHGQKVGRIYEASLGRCANTKCNGIVLIVKAGNEIQLTSPPELVDFSIEGLPANLIKTLEEAIQCHANGAYRAAAMMVRRLLEEVCDENKANGKTLHDRLIDLKSKIVLPEALFQAMGELKALGNDAAHIEAKAYDNIGKEEAEDSIELAKEILKALYQLQGLVGRLQARKKTASAS